MVRRTSTKGKLTRAQLAKKLGFDSGIEMEVQQYLSARLGENVVYHPIRIQFIQPAKVRHYQPDFVLRHNDVVIETKGRFTLPDRQKHLMLKKEYPDLDLRLLFDRPFNTISKKSKTTYADWCDKNGFIWADWSSKTIPEDWLK